MTIPATAECNNQTITTTKTSIPSGNITEAEAQDFLQGVDTPYYFNRAELRAENGDKTIIINSIRLENGYYYVTTDNISGEAAFEASSWNVVLVYDEAVTLTLDVVLEPGAGEENLIDGTPVTELGNNSDSFRVTYQVPKNCSRDIVFTIGAAANLTVVDNTNTNNPLFSSAVAGYERKSYTLNLSGMQGNQSYTATFTGVGGENRYILDWSYRKTASNNYHGYNIFWKPADGDRITLNSNATTTTTQIADNGRLEIEFGYKDYTNWVPDHVSINGTFIDIPWPTADYPVSGQTANITRDLTEKTPQSMMMLETFKPE